MGRAFWWFWRRLRYCWCLPILLLHLLFLLSFAFGLAFGFLWGCRIRFTQLFRCFECRVSLRSWKRVRTRFRGPRGVRLRWISLIFWGPFDLCKCCRIWWPGSHHRTYLEVHKGDIAAATLAASAQRCALLSFSNCCLCKKNVGLIWLELAWWISHLKSFWLSLFKPAQQYTLSPITSELEELEGAIQRTISPVDTWAFQTWK